MALNPHPSNTTLPTQTRLILPAWLGVADALLAAASSGKRPMLREMYEVRAVLCCPVLGQRRWHAGRDAFLSPGFPLLQPATHCPGLPLTVGSAGSNCSPAAWRMQAAAGHPIFLSSAAALTPNTPSPLPAPPMCLQHWPFFQSLIDLIEMVMSKADMRIAALYDTVLVADAQVQINWGLSTGLV